MLRSPVNRVKGVRATVRKFKQTEELMTGVRVIFFNGGIFFLYICAWFHTPCTIFSLLDYCNLLFSCLSQEVLSQMCQMLRSQGTYQNKAEPTSHLPSHPFTDSPLRTGKNTRQCLLYTRSSEFLNFCILIPPLSLSNHLICSLSPPQIQGQLCFCLRSS